MDVRPAILALDDHAAVLSAVLRDLRKRYGRIMSSLTTKHKCPSCASPSVKRESVGLWECKKCGHTFAGGAYQPSTKLGQISHRIRAQN